MQYIYIVITQKGQILGAYADPDQARAVCDALPGSRVSCEPVITK